VGAPLWEIEIYYKTHTAVNEPSGFKSKHLNFFFRRCKYAVYY